MGAGVEEDDGALAGASLSELDFGAAAGDDDEAAGDFFGEAEGEVVGAWSAAETIPEMLTKTKARKIITTWRAIVINKINKTLE